MNTPEEQDPEIAEMELLLCSMSLARPSLDHEDRINDLFTSAVEREISSLEPRPPSPLLEARVEETLNSRVEEILVKLKPLAPSAALDARLEDAFLANGMAAHFAALTPLQPSAALDLRIEETLAQAQMEKLIVSLPAQAPSPKLEQRLAERLAQSPGWRLHNSVWWVAAAALLLIIPLDSLLKHNSNQPQSLPESLPTSVARTSQDPISVGSTRELPSYEGAPIKSADGSWFRPVLNRQVDNEVWVDPDSGAVIERETPREVMKIVPVHFD